MFGFASTFQEIEPDETGLFRWLAPRLTEQDRHDIAACDYGDSIEAHRAAIDEILRSERVAHRFDWVPREVLALTRWTDIDPADDSQLAVALHRQRLFATGALMAQLSLDPLDEDATENTLFGYVDSAIALGQQPLALGLLRWIAGRLDALAKIEAKQASESGDTDFEPVDITGREVAYLPLAILMIDRSQVQPTLTAEAIRAAVELGQALDHPYLEDGAPRPQAALFHDTSEGLREKGWRRLLQAALDRELAPEAAQRERHHDAVISMMNWWTRALVPRERS